MPSKKVITAIALFSAIFLGTYLSEPSQPATLTSLSAWQVDSVANMPFENISLEAKSAYVFDIAKNEPIFKLNANAQLPLASLTKIMTAVSAKENLPEWLKIDIPIEAIMQEGDSGFLAGEQWRIEDLLDAMLISSSNDAAFAVASSGRGLSYFISSMNSKAEELNLAQTYFLNPTGLDLSESVAGAYGSAKDVAKMMVYGIKNYPTVFEITGFEDFQIMALEFKNTNKLIEDIPNILAGKTGFSDLAGGNLAVIADVGLYHPIIIVVLGSSEQGRFDDVKKLYGETLKYITVRY